jgi:hypothetical protein
MPAPNACEHPMTHSSPPEGIASVCTGFLERVSGNKYFTAARDFVVVHPELLGDDADSFLAQHSDDPHSSPIAYAYARMRILFRRCVEVGINEAFDEEHLKELIGQFMGDGRFHSKEAFVEQHPELLTALAERVLTDSAARQRSEGARRIFQGIQTLFRRCREIGTAAAFAEVRGDRPSPDPTADSLVGPLRELIATNGPTAFKDVLRRHPALLDPAVEQLLKTDDPRLKPTLERIALLLGRCRAEGLDAAFPTDQNEPERLAAYVTTAHTQLGSFLFADSALEKKQLLEQNPQLLEPLVQVILEQFVTELEPTSQGWVARHARLLATARTKGIDVAFARYSDTLAAVDGALKDNDIAVLQRLADFCALSSDSSERPEQQSHLIEACEGRLLSDPDLQPAERTVLHMMAAQAYARLPMHSTSAPWNDALRHCVEGLATCNASSNPFLFANLNMELARILSQLPSGDRYANQMRALHHNRAALCTCALEY